MSGPAIDARSSGVPTAWRIAWPWRFRSEAGYQTPSRGFFYDIIMSDFRAQFDPNQPGHIGVEREPAVGGTKSGTFMECSRHVAMPELCR